MKNFPLAIATIALTSILWIQGVQAQESHGQRFSFPVNYWKVEQSRMPHSGNPQPLVRNGSVPQGTDFLGVDIAPTALQRSTVAPNITPGDSVGAGLHENKSVYRPSFGAPSFIPAAMPPQPMPSQQPMPRQQCLVPTRPTPIPPLVHHNAPQKIAPHVISQLPKRPSTAARTMTNQHGQGFAVVAGKIMKTKTSNAHNAPGALSYDKGYSPGGSIASTTNRSTEIEVKGHVLDHKR